MTLPHPALVRWNWLWRFSGSSVFCRQCHARQDQVQITEPFVHALHCQLAKLPVHFPLQEFQDLLVQSAARLELDRSDRRPR